MLNKDVFREGILNLMFAFPNWKMEIDNPKAMAYWYSFFEKMKNADFLKMVHDYCKHDDRLPTVRGLLDCRPEVKPKPDTRTYEEVIRDARIALGLQPEGD